MAINYDAGRVIGYDVKAATIEIAWYVNAVGINNMTPLVINHKIPIEAETNAWTRAQLMSYFLASEVPAIPDMPQWAIDEAENTYRDIDIRFRRVDPTGA